MKMIGQQIRRGFAAVILAACLGNTSAPAQTADQFPNKPITFILPFAPGTSFEAVIRRLLDQAGKILGQSIIVVNRPGGNFVVAATAITTSRPDGYTIGYPGSSSLFITPFLQAVTFDPVKDFTPISQFSNLTFGIVVRGDSPYKTIQDVVAAARKNPQKLTFGTTGSNSIQSFAMEQFLREEGVELTNVAYRGAADVSTALAGGFIDMGATLPNFPDVESGQNRVLMLLSDTPSADYPGVPTLKDLGHDIPVPVFVGASGPAGIPQDIVNKLDTAFAKAMHAPEVLKLADQLKVNISYRNSTDLAAYIDRSYHVYEKLVKQSGRKEP
jgi:tripartite-type tricarboxylate transporter receptor subunit TctC